MKEFGLAIVLVIGLAFLALGLVAYVGANDALGDIEAGATTVESIPLFGGLLGQSYRYDAQESVQELRMLKYGGLAGIVVGGCLLVTTLVLVIKD